MSTLPAMRFARCFFLGWGDVRTQILQCVLAAFVKIDYCHDGFWLARLHLIDPPSNSESAIRN